MSVDWTFRCHRHLSVDRSARKRRAALFVAALILSWPNPIAAQRDGVLQERKGELELQKLELEVKRLKEDSVLQQRKVGLESEKLELEVKTLQKWWLTLFFGSVGFIGGLLATLGTVWLARLTRRGALTQATHQRRLECYPRLVAATAPFAVYFPSSTAFDPDQCKTIGQHLRKWYFEEGGLLMSKDARDAYFRLAFALTRASSVERLAADHSLDVSHETLRKYRKALSKYDRKYYMLNLSTPTIRDVKNWPFGPITDKNEPSSQDVERALKIKDYVFLQHLSSLLRTSLTEDLLSRRLPN